MVRGIENPRLAQFKRALLESTPQNTPPGEGLDREFVAVRLIVWEIAGEAELAPKAKDHDFMGFLFSWASTTQPARICPQSLV